MWISCGFVTLKKVVIQMIFLSMLLRQSVYDVDNHRVGTLRDVYVELKETFPVVTALVVNGPMSTGRIVIPFSQVHSIEEGPIRLTVPQEQIASYTPREDELLLMQNLLDTQIVDTQGVRVVKINDLKLAQIKRTARLVGADISFGGLLRRLSGPRTMETLNRILPKKLPERTVTWNYVEPIQRVSLAEPALVGAGAGVGGIVPQVQLNVSHTKLADLHPADIADILEQLDVDEAGAVLNRLDMETAADALNELEAPRQSELLSELNPERASDLLERLAPDDAADILSDMAPLEAERLLNLMPADEAQPIRELLRYGAETAGGIMTTEVLSLPQDATVEDALNYLRQHSEHLEMVYYLYIVDHDRHLTGVVSLRQLVTANPAAMMGSLMDTDVIKVTLDTDQEEVARVIAKYDLLGVPVVDAEDHLVGLVTVDDVIDVIHEEQAEDLSEISGADVEESNEEEKFSWQTALNRFSWLAVNVVAGFVLAVVIYQVFGPVLAIGTAFAQVTGLEAGLHSRLALNGMICLTPMLLMTSGSAGAQALGIAGWRLRTQHGLDFWRRFLREIQLGTFGGILTCLAVALLSWFLFHSLALSLVVGLGFGFTLLIAYICGLVLPNLLQHLHLRGSLITAPLLDPLIAVISLSCFIIITLALVNHFTIM
jgi:magnesium transporter